MARFGKRRLPITQNKLLRELRADGRRMARSTLNRQLLALERDDIVRRRSYRPRWIAGQVSQRATVYSISLRGQQWISLWAKVSAIPAARPPGVPFMGHIRSTLKLYGVRGT